MGNIAKGIVYGGGIIAFGYALMKWTVPTEQEMRERLAPELRRQADQLMEKSEDQRKALMDQMRAAAQPDKAPVWQTEPPSSNPKPAL